MNVIVGIELRRYIMFGNGYASRRASVFTESRPAA